MLEIAGRVYLHFAVSALPARWGQIPGSQGRLNLYQWAPDRTTSGKRPGCVGRCTLTDRYWLAILSSGFFFSTLE